MNFLRNIYYKRIICKEIVDDNFDTADFYLTFYNTQLKFHYIISNQIITKYLPSHPSSQFPSLPIISPYSVLLPYFPSVADNSANYLSHFNIPPPLTLILPTRMLNWKFCFIAQTFERIIRYLFQFGIYAANW